MFPLTTTRGFSGSVRSRWVSSSIVAVRTSSSSRSGCPKEGVCRRRDQRRRREDAPGGSGQLAFLVAVFFVVVLAVALAVFLAVVFFAAVFVVVAFLAAGLAAVFLA